MKNRTGTRPCLSLYAVGLIVGSLFFSAPGFAASSDDYFDLSLEQLTSAVVISASKKEESVSDVPAAIFVITNEDIARSGVTTIPDALRMVPGVHVAQADSNSWAVSIRGFNSVLANKLLVLIDGRTIYNPVFGGVLWEAHDLMLEDIERIEVVRGPGGTLWGANAVNGVINILTKKARDTQGNLVSGLYGNEEEGTVSMRHGGTIGDGGFYRIYAKDFNRDASREPLSDGDNFDEWNGYRSGFRADWDDTFTLQGDIYRVRTEQLRTDFALSAPFATVREQTLEYEGANILGRWTEARDDGSQLSFQTYLDWARRDEPYNFIDNRLIFDTEAQYNMPQYGRHEIIIGGGYRFMADDENPKGNRNVSFSTEEHYDSLYNFFIQNKITLIPEEWYLTLGSKFEHNEYSGFEIQPNARLQWHPDPEQTVWGAVSRAVRTPTIIEEDTTSTIATAANIRLALVGNEDFAPEELISYELGYRNQITPDISGDVALFYNQYDQLTTIGALTASLVNNGIDPLHLLIPVQFENEMKGKAFGFEVAGNWAVNSDVKVTANYSYMRLILDADSNATFTQDGAEDLYPVHQAGVRTSWNINDHWTLDSGVYYTDELDGQDIDGHIRLDMNLGWQINENVRFNLIGQNLMDSSHREFGGDDDLNTGEIERSVLGKLTWQF